MRATLSTLLLIAIPTIAHAGGDAHPGPTSASAPPDRLAPDRPAPDRPAEAAPPIEIMSLGSLDPAVAAALNRTDGGARARIVQVGAARYVEATVGAHLVYLELDPAAPLLSLSPRFLSGAGMRVEQVGGAQLGLLGRLALGSMTLTSLTYTTCASCAGEVAGRPVVGKLGQSVLSRLHVVIDDDAMMLDVSPGPAFEERVNDVAPWITLETQQEPWVGRFGQDLRLHTTARSAAPQAAEIAVRYDCDLPPSGGVPRRIAVISSAREVAPVGRVKLETQAPFAACMRVSAHVALARWR